MSKQLRHEARVSEVVRLAHERCHADVVHLVHGVFGDMPGHHDDRHERIDLLDLAEDFNAADVWQSQIKQDSTERIIRCKRGLELVDRRLPVAGFVDRHVEDLAVCLENKTDSLLVLDQKEFRRSSQVV